MSEKVVVGVHEDGRAVAIKHATGEPERARLRREAELLEEARHAGVVELVAFEDANGEARLCTAWAGGSSLVSHRSLSTEAVAAVVADITATVADLHDRGVVHGRIQADHVLLDGDGRPVLCGLAEAGRPGDGGRSPADDVAAIGTLLSTLLDSPGPPRRPLAGRPATATLQRTLVALAARATDPDPSRRPSTRSLAQSLADVTDDRPLAAAMARPAGGPRRIGRPDGASRGSAPTAGPGTGTGAAGGDPFGPLLGSGNPPRLLFGGRVAVPGWLDGRVKLVGAVTATIIGLALAATVVLGRGGAGSETAAVAPTTLFAPTVELVASTSTVDPLVWPPSPTTIAIDPSCAPTPNAAAADVDGDGCPEALTVDGSDVVAGSIRLRAGLAGDVIAIGDWDCDGLMTPAVARPATGEVFVYRAWATPAHPVTATAVTVVPGLTAIAAAAGAGGPNCARIAVTMGDASERLVDVAPTTIDSAP